MRETETLVKAIREFDVGVVLVIDDERLEDAIAKKLQSTQSGVKIIRVPKSSGISASRQSAEEVERELFNEFTDYFRGKHYQVFSKNEKKREELGLVEQAVRNELDPQRLNIPIDKIKIFEVKGYEIPLSALPAGSTHPEWSTWVDLVTPQDLEKGIADYKHKILGVKLPRDI